MTDDNVKRFFKKILDIDVESEYKHLENVGKIPINKLRDRDVLMEALNEAQDNARRANTVALKAKSEYERWKVDHNAKLRGLKRKAEVRLKGWRDKYGIKKQITQEEVIENVCEHEDTREQYRKLIEEKNEMEEMRDACKSLAEKWDGRRFLLGNQARLLEGIVEPSTSAVDEYLNASVEDNRRKWKERRTKGGRDDEK